MACGMVCAPSATLTFWKCKRKRGSRAATGQRLGSSGRSGLACELQPQAAKFSAGCATGASHLCVVFQTVESSTPVPSPPSSENTPPGLPTASVTMGQYYNLFGQKVASQYVSGPLSIGIASSILNTNSFPTACHGCSWLPLRRCLPRFRRQQQDPCYSPHQRFQL